MEHPNGSTAPTMTTLQQILDGQKSLWARMDLLEARIAGLGDGLQQGIADLTNREKGHYEQIHRHVEMGKRQVIGQLMPVILELGKKLDALQGKALVSDFKRHAKAGKRGKNGKR